MESDRVKEEMKRFVRNYSLNTYKKDYDVICDLTFKYPINNFDWKKHIKRLRNHLNNNNIVCDGIVVSEFSKGMNHLHNHILMYCGDEKYYKVEGKIHNFWKGIGYSNIRKYDCNQNYSEYVCKYMNGNNTENWDFIMNL